MKPRTCERDARIAEIAEAVDPRLALEVEEAIARSLANPRPLPLAADRQLVLAGHRASGKTRLLSLIGSLAQRPTLDLDAEIERQSGRPIREWLPADSRGFRAAERTIFESLPKGYVVSVGGGFLSLHADLLAGHTTILVPLTFETYRERLLADSSRPRLRPELSAVEELEVVFREREVAHARVPTVALADAVAALIAGARQ